MTFPHQTSAKRKPLDLIQKWLVAQYWAQQNPPLRRAAYVVLMRLLDRQNPKTGRCDPSAARLAEETGFSKRSVRSAFKELEERGAIKRFRLSGRSCNQFLIFSVDELGQATRLAALKPRAGRCTGLNSVSVPDETRFRPNVKRSSPEKRKEKIKKNGNAENAAVSVENAVKKTPLPIDMDLAQFEKRVAKVFEKEGHGYEGLVLLPNGDVEQTYVQMTTGDLTFSGAVGQLLEMYKALNERS